jgi:hypothetical protein
MRLLSSKMPEIATIRAINHIYRPVYVIVYVLIFYKIFMLKYLHSVFPEIARLAHIGNRSHDYCSRASTHYTAPKLAIAAFLLVIWRHDNCLLIYGNYRMTRPITCNHQAASRKPVTLWE